MRSFLFITVLICGLGNSLFSQTIKYELKSAIIEKETNTMGQTMKIMWYFDDYGNREAMFTTIQMPPEMGGERSVMVVSEDNTVTTIDLGNKVGQQTLLNEAPLNYLQLTPEVREQYNIREAGEESILGRPCKIYKLSRTEMGMEVDTKVWVWKGIHLKMEASSGGMTVYTETTTNIQENVSIPADKLAIPADVEVF